MTLGLPRSDCLGFTIYSLGFWVFGLGFEVYGLHLFLQGLGFMVYIMVTVDGLVFMIPVGFRV